MGSCFISEAQKISRYEWWWTLGHPFAAVKVKLMSKKCYEIYNRQANAVLNSKSGAEVSKNLDKFSNGGKLDAYRHVFFMASFAQKVKSKKLRKLGRAHEKTNYKMFLKNKQEYGEISDSLSSVMDLFNNEIAFKIGSENKKLNANELSDLAIEQIKSGKALVMKRKKNGTYLDCNDQPIDLNLYIKNWSVPKCLVPSDYNYPD